MKIGMVKQGKMHSRISCALVLGLVTASVFASAQSASAQYARAFANAPTNANFTQVTLSSTLSDKYANDDQPSDLKTRSNGFNFLYTRTMPGFTGNAAGLGFMAGYTTILGYNSDDQVTKDQNGMGDPSFTFDYNLYGAKAMHWEEFAKTLGTTYGGLHGIITMPWGEYDSSSAKNVGANRYSGKLTYNQSFAFDEAKTWLDFYLDVRVFGDNTEFLGDKTLSQEPLYGFETHVSRNLSPLMWVGLGAIWSKGGATEVDGAPGAGSQNNWKGVAELGTRTWKGGSMILTYTQTLVRENDDAEVKSLALNLMMVF